MLVLIPTTFFGNHSGLLNILFGNYGVNGSYDLTIGQLISIILPNLLIGAGVIMFFLMLGGGFMMIHGAGSDDAKEAAKGKSAVSSAMIGFLLVISAYFILQILKVLTGIDFLNPTTL